MSVNAASDFCVLMYALARSRGHVAHDFVPVGHDPGEGRELVGRVHDDSGGVDGGDVLEDEGSARDEGEGAGCEVDAAGVIARVEGELGPGYGDGNDDLLGDLVADDGAVGAGARIDHGVEIFVRDLKVSQQDVVFFCLCYGGFPSLRLDVLLHTSNACRQLTERLVNTIRGCDCTCQVIDVFLLRHPQDNEPLDAPELEKRLQKVAFVGRVFNMRRLNMNRISISDAPLAVHKARTSCLR